MITRQGPGIDNDESSATASVLASPETTRLRPDTVIVNDIPEVLLATVAIIWDGLSDEDKAILHTAATWGPEFIIPDDLLEIAAPHLTGKGMHRIFAKSVEILAATWRLEAGRISP